MRWIAVDWVLVSGATVDSVHGLSVGPRWLCFTVGGLEPELGMIRWSRPQHTAGVGWEWEVFLRWTSWGFEDFEDFEDFECGSWGPGGVW